jgi:mRNA-degrading endonuclease RelE of RelBE toxin-antitoxin system
METNHPIFQVETSGCFERQFRALLKRYRKIRSDVQPVIEQLQAGEVLGDRLSGLNIVVLKIRVKNSDIQKGKSAGYRLIYQIETPTSIILLAIYAKSDQSSISTTEIEDIVEAFKRQQEQSEI